MKQLTSYNRAAGYLNKIFDLLNQEGIDLFGEEENLNYLDPIYLIVGKSE